MKASVKRHVPTSLPRIQRPPTSKQVAMAVENPVKGNERGLVCRADGRLRRRTTVYMPPALHVIMAQRCIETGEDVSDYVAKVVAYDLDVSYLRNG